MVAGYDNRLCSWLLVVTIMTMTIMVTKTMAEEVPAPKPAFYETAKEGWFWYHDPHPEIPKEANTPEKSTITREAGPKVFETKNPSMDKYTINDIWNLHPDEFQGLRHANPVSGSGGANAGSAGPDYKTGDPG